MGWPDLHSISAPLPVGHDHTIFFGKGLQKAPFFLTIFLEYSICGYPPMHLQRVKNPKWPSIYS